MHRAGRATWAPPDYGQAPTRFVCHCGVSSSWSAVVTEERQRSREVLVVGFQMAEEEVEGQRANAIPLEDVVAGIRYLDVVHLDPRLAQCGDQSPRMLDRHNRVQSAVDDEKWCGLFIDVRKGRGVPVDIGNLGECPTEEG